jgi:ankyrin repeat protein
MSNMEGEQKANTAKKNDSAADIDLALWNTCNRGIEANAVSVQAAIDAGADVNYVHKGWSCLSIAVVRGHNELVDLLLSAGADKDAKTQKGSTALIIAAARGHRAFDNG